MIKKYNISNLVYLMKLYIVFLIDLKFLFSQPRGLGQGGVPYFDALVV